MNVRDLTEFKVVKGTTWKPSHDEIGTSFCCDVCGQNVFYVWQVPPACDHGGASLEELHRLNTALLADLLDAKRRVAEIDKVHVATVRGIKANAAKDFAKYVKLAIIESRRGTPDAVSFINELLGQYLAKLENS